MVKVVSIGTFDMQVGSWRHCFLSRREDFEEYAHGVNDLCFEVRLGIWSWVAEL